MTNKNTKKTTKNYKDMPEPLVIPQEEHGISESDLEREAVKVLRRLQEAGHTAYLVGGGVRDIFLKKAPKDFDISTDARPGQIRKIFRNSRIIGRRFRLVQVFFHGNKILEVSTFRQRSEFDVDGKDQVLAANNTFGTPVDDAFRRDLTINALFYEIEHNTIIDYVGGVADLENGVIRLVGDPDTRITRDPARIMRVIRHAARTGFTIETATWDAVREHMEKLELCPTSRIRDEFFKDLKGGACAPWLPLAVESGLFVKLLPFYGELLAEKDTAFLEALQDRLVSLFTVVDRLNRNGGVPEHVILALILAPWAEEVLELMATTTLKGAYEVSKKTREQLAPTFTKLNIKRGMQDSIARCLATLPILINHDRDSNGKGWPKWLRKKSYFNDGLQMFKIVREADGGGEAVLVAPTEAAKDGAKGKAEPRRRRSSANRGPGFAPNVKGGVFGFRRW